MITTLLLAALSSVSSAPTSVTQPVVVQDNEFPDKRADVKEWLSTLKGHIGKRGAEDSAAVALIEKLTDEFQKSGEKDRAGAPVHVVVRGELWRGPPGSSQPLVSFGFFLVFINSRPGFAWVPGPRLLGGACTACRTGAQTLAVLIEPGAEETHSSSADSSPSSYYSQVSTQTFEHRC